jgi:F0F1-type ATP synthase membrane subunit a
MRTFLTILFGIIFVTIFSTGCDREKKQVPADAQVLFDAQAFDSSVTIDSGLASDAGVN